MASYRDYNPSKHNDFMTPKYIFEEIKDLIPKDKTISMPFYGDGKCGTYMKELGFKVIHQQEDFFENDRGELVIDNPPYEIKGKIIEELVKRNKPFMLIVPVSTMCYNYSKILSEHFQLCIPKKRPKYIYYDKKTKKLDPNWKKKNAAFDSVWICWKMNLEHDINFL
jgi:hypothetical protein